MTPKSCALSGSSPPPYSGRRLNSLEDQARSFAEVLTTLVNGTVTVDAEFHVTQLADQPPAAWIAPAGSELFRPKPIPLSADGSDARLWLAAHFAIRLDEEGEYLSVQSSRFALCVTQITKNSLLRIEYERGKGHEPDAITDHSRPAAHLHLHGSSTQLGHAQALAGSEYKSLESIHFPVGGRRFRPSLEDFIEFLYNEDLLPSVHPRWREVLQSTRSGYLDGQLRAAVRRNPDVASAQLTSMGYVVSNPPRV